jgi:intein/homing endonuclease
MEDYINKHLSLSKLAEIYKISRYKLTKLLNKNGIKIRNHNIVDVNYKVDNCYFDKINTESKAYWLGFIYADGCINTSGNSLRFSIELADYDFNHLKKFRKAIKSNHPITERQNSKRNTCNISINSRNIVNKLIDIGCVTNKTYNGFIDPNILKTTEMKIAFIRGYLDGNGYIDKGDKYRIVFTLQSEKLVEDLNIMIRELKIHTRIQKDQEYFRIHIERKNDFYQLLNLIYKNASIYLDRKYEIFLRRTMPFGQETDQIISAKLSWEVLPNMYEHKGNVLG